MKNLRDSLRRKNELVSKNSFNQSSFSTLIKWNLSFVTLCGITAWLAGQAYNVGYWSVAGWNGPITRLSLQETAFMGFVGPIFNWLFVGLTAMGISAYMFALEFLSKLSLNKVSTPPRFLLKLRDWIQKQGKLDPTIKRLCATMMIAGFGFVFFVVIPIIMWVFAAYADGKTLATDQICRIRKAKSLPTVVNLADGNKLNGRFLERSEKLSVLLDRTSIYVITVGDRPQLLDTTDVRELKCP